MEQKIGEIFEHNGEWYQCVEGTGCYKCCFNFNEDTCIAENPHCTCRSDRKNVVYKKLEKVGEPYERYIGSNKSIKVQRYRLPYRYAILPKEPFMILEPNYKNSIEIGIKQTKEDMEENKLNLKPFDIQKAREGNPVCTRDGRKARIICFDSKNDPQRPIVALVEHNDNELLYEYTIEGKERFSHISTTGTSDLMMLPEKKEGWVNVYKGGLLDTKSYPTKKEAFDKACPEGYIDTVKINWSE